MGRVVGWCQVNCRSVIDWMSMIHDCKSWVSKVLTRKTFKICNIRTVPIRSHFDVKFFLFIKTFWFCKIFKPREGSRNWSKMPSCPTSFHKHNPIILIGEFPHFSLSWLNNHFFWGSVVRRFVSRNVPYPHWWIFVSWTVLKVLFLTRNHIFPYFLSFFTHSQSDPQNTIQITSYSHTL